MSSAEKATIRISTKCVDSGGRARLEVSDNGPGIPPAIISRIFDPFFTTKPAGIGTGLGLTIVMGVMREHGGQVKVVTPAKGGRLRGANPSACRVRDPRQRAQPGGVSGTQLTAHRSRLRWGRQHRNARARGGRRAYGSAADYQRRARRQGFQVEASLDGYEALERAARASYDLVVCDMKMAGLDGQHFYETLACIGKSTVETLSLRHRRCAFVAHPRISGAPSLAARRETFPGRGTAPKKCAVSLQTWGRASRRREQLQRVRRFRGTPNDAKPHDFVGQ